MHRPGRLLGKPNRAMQKELAEFVPLCSMFGMPCPNATPASAEQTLPDPSPDHAAACARCAADPVTDRLLARLDLLAEAGMDLVEDLRVRTLARTAAMIAQPDTVEATEPERDVGLMFDRLSRAIRLTTMMQVSLATERRNREALDKAAAVAVQAEETKRAATADHAQKTRKKADAKRIVDEEIIEHEERDPRDAADLREDLEILFERNNEFADILHLPLGEIVARISWLLGLDPDWNEWKFELWAPDAARVKRPDTLESVGLTPDPKFGQLASAPPRDVAATGTGPP